MKYTAVCDMWNASNVDYYFRCNDDNTGLQKLLADGTWQDMNGIDRSQPRLYRPVSEEEVNREINKLIANK